MSDTTRTVVAELLRNPIRVLVPRRRFADVLKSIPNEHIEKVATGAGAESVNLKNGSKVIAYSTAKATRGYSADMVIADEATSDHERLELDPCIQMGGRFVWLSSDETGAS